MESSNALRLVVLPSDPIAAYEAAGYDWLERYFNPEGMFREVYVLSPIETGERRAYGMVIRGVPERQYAAVLKELRPHVVRAYGGYWACHLACKNRVDGIPVIVSLHDTASETLHPSLRYADLLICVSEAVRRKAIELGADPRRTRFLPNRIDPEIFHPVVDAASFRRLESRFSPGKRILHVGRKTDQKNLDTLIKALRELPNEYFCIFIGRGPTDAYVRLAAQIGVAERCFWVESVKNSELPEWYSWCDCMCTPSRWEGFGIVFIEAAACGAAIVTSDIAPMNEYLVHDKSAFLVKDFTDPKALAAGILAVCGDREYRGCLGQGALRASQRFHRAAVDAAEAAIYREALRLPSPPLGRRLGRLLWKSLNKKIQYNYPTVG